MPDQKKKKKKEKIRILGVFNPFDIAWCVYKMNKTKNSTDT